MKRLSTRNRALHARLAWVLTLLSVAILAPLGCHSAFVNATIVNRSGEALRLIELDYPNASFGTQVLPDGETFNYRFKILGTGPTRLSWTDAQHKDHTSAGPDVHEGQEGSLTVTIGPDAAAWKPALRP